MVKRPHSRCCGLSEQQFQTQRSSLVVIVSSLGDREKFKKKAFLCFKCESLKSGFLYSDHVPTAAMCDVSNLQVENLMCDVEEQIPTLLEIL